MLEKPPPAPYLCNLPSRFKPRTPGGYVPPIVLEEYKTNIIIIGNRKKILWYSTSDFT
jgi:hypothetical protein